MQTTFDLESELIEHEYGVVLDNQDLDEDLQRIQATTTNVSFEMDVLEKLIGETETLPELADPESVINQFSMECAIGATGSQCVGMGVDMEDTYEGEFTKGDDSKGLPNPNAASKDGKSSGWTGKIKAIFDRLKKMVVDLFNRIVHFVQKIWKYMTDRTVRIVGTLEKLRDKVKMSDGKLKNETMKRRAGNYLSSDPTTATMEIDRTNVVFKDFAGVVFPKVFTFCTEYVKVVSEFKKDLQRKEDLKNKADVLDALKNKLLPLGKYLDFKEVGGLIRGLNKDGEGRQYAASDMMMNKYIAGIADSGTEKPIFTLFKDDYKPHYVIPFIALVDEKSIPKVDNTIGVLKKEALLKVIDLTIDMAKSFDRELSSKLNRIAALRMGFLSMVQSRYGEFYSTGNSEGSFREVIKAIRVGITVLGATITQLNGATAAHTDCVMTAANYALDSYKQYE